MFFLRFYKYLIWNGSKKNVVISQYNNGRDAQINVSDAIWNTQYNCFNEMPIQQANTFGFYPKLPTYNEIINAKATNQNTTTSESYKQPDINKKITETPTMPSFPQDNTKQIVSMHKPPPYITIDSSVLQQTLSPQNQIESNAAQTISSSPDKVENVIQPTNSFVKDENYLSSSQIPDSTTITTVSAHPNITDGTLNQDKNKN